MTKLYDLRLCSGVCDVKELYYRAVDCELKNDAVVFCRGGKLAFNTYFNCLSYSKLKNFTTIRHLSYSLRAKGKFVVRIVQSKLTKEILDKFEGFDYAIAHRLPFEYPHIDFEKSVLEEKEIDGDGTITFDISALDGDGLCYLEVESLEDGAVFFGGSLETSDEKQREPKVAIAICTFKREKYVLANVERMRAEFDNNPILKRAFDVIVVDNGQTMTLEDSENFRVVKNKNLGGSGGFTRGIIEAYRAKKYTHFLLQDDDIVFDPKMLEKVLAYLRFAKSDTLSIGASMIHLSDMTYQHEMSAAWDGVKLQSNGHAYNLSKEIDILRNEEQKFCTYSGWWFLCQPVAAVKESGLPLPFFIKYDDVEYPIRSAKGIMLVNGIGVWHDSFDSKYSAELEYYIKRNELVTTALHFDGKLGAVLKRLVRGVAKQLVYQRYQAAEFIIEGYKDFFKGPKYLMNLDAEAMHASLRARTIRQYGKEQLKQQGYDVEQMTPYLNIKSSYLKKVLTLNGYLVPTCFYDKKERKEGRLVSLTQSVPSDFYKSKITVQYDAETDRGFVTKQKRGMLFKYGFKMAGVAIRILFEYGHVKKQYLKAENELTSFENWEKLLGLPPHEEE